MASVCHLNRTSLRSSLPADAGPLPLTRPRVVTGLPSSMTGTMNKGAGKNKAVTKITALLRLCMKLLDVEVVVVRAEALECLTIKHLTVIRMSDADEELSALLAAASVEIDGTILGNYPMCV